MTKLFKILILFVSTNVSVVCLKALSVVQTVERQSAYKGSEGTLE